MGRRRKINSSSYITKKFTGFPAKVVARDAASWRKHPPSKSNLKCKKYVETRNSCLLLVEKWNESRHLVFWLLGTLIGLRDRVRRLVA